jgi:NAD(P)-dependent dehydrogenase (short-subunit alcohol dehydrogenase family)
MPCDVSRLDQVRSLAEFTIAHFGSYEIWVNNAGLSAPYGPSVHIQPEEFQAVINTNILGVYNGSITAMQHFLPRRIGTLINITGRGDRGPQPMQNAYASSKAWMRSFTESLAREYQNSGVNIFAFNPGMMRTDMTQQVSAVQGYENRLEILDKVLRILSVSPDASAQTAVRLASSAANRRHKIFVRQMTISQMAGGMLRELGRRISGKTGEPQPVQVTVVPPAIDNQ